MHRVLSRGLLSFLVASIVLTQWLALVHRIAHNPWASSQHSLQHAAVEHHHGHAHHASSGLDQLFTHQDGDITCQLQDTLASMDAGCAYIKAIYIPHVAILLVAFSQILSTARSAALFEARGPPALH